MNDIAKAKHCKTCTCGLTHVEWSDREAWVNLSDPSDIAEVVMGCALDHYYDRTGDGIPYNFPDALRNKLAPVVVKHLSVIEPDWKNKTVDMDNKKREVFKQDLVAVIAVKEREQQQ